MNTLVLFTTEVVHCFGISGAVIISIKPLFRGVLTESCGINKRAVFWVMFTQFLLIVMPFLRVVYVAPTEISGEINLAEMMKNTLFRSLPGNFMALTVIGQMIWKSTGRMTEAKNDFEKQPVRG